MPSLIHLHLRMQFNLKSFFLSLKPAFAVIYFSLNCHLLFLLYLYSMEQWDTIYVNNSSKMLGVCRRYVKDIQLAEDLMHNAFITAMSKIDSYSGQGKFEGWLRKIVINTALLHLRKNKNGIISEKELNENYSETIQEEESSSESKRNTIEEANLSKEELLEVVDQLPEHHKMVFNLYVIDGYKHTQIGQMLNISSGTSKSHLARARKKIQQLLFEKAKNKKDNENKKSFLFFLFAPKQNYIDKLYKDAFSSFEIKPQKEIHFQDGSKMVNTLETTSILKQVIGNKALLVSLSGVIISVTIGAFILFHPKNTYDQKINSIEIKPSVIEEKSITVPPVKVDSISKEHAVQIQVKKEIQKPISTAMPAPPIKIKDSVEVKKPFVVHKTAIQHDTIIQKVPVKNEK
jgi:RNA polymerase sigma factor (sigma-70 family)